MPPWSWVLRVTLLFSVMATLIAVVAGTQDTPEHALDFGYAHYIREAFPHFYLWHIAARWAD
jgi:hypothetical protein